MASELAVPPDPASSRPRMAATGRSPDIARPTPGEPATGGPVSRRSVPEILAGANLADPEERARVVAEMTAAEEARYAAVLARASELGIPVRKEGPGNRVAILHDFRGDRPVYRVTLNANAAISSGASLIRVAPYSLDGSGVKVGVWDEGSVRYTHQELTGRVTRKNITAAYSDHGTHVAGTIGASGVQANARGMAPGVMIDSYDWNSDHAEMTAAGAVSSTDTARIPISNHSYGYTVVADDMGRYETEASAVDAIAASLPFYQPFWAAGNEQTDLPSLGGYQSITFVGLAKNVLTVGATDDAVTSGARDPSKAVIAYFSSLGPCDDGRIKPDVVANGVNLYSSISTGDTAYATYSGTSMATPSAAGSATLLEQLYAQNFSGTRMRASMLKALLIHTADDRGNAGPDYTYGWGLINVKAAADVILTHKASSMSPKMIEGSLSTAATSKTHTFTWDGTSPIRATLCWTDPAGAAQTAVDSRTPNLVHNLDLRITAPDGTTTYQPFIMPFVGTWTQASMSSLATTGDNNVDNVEQVRITAPAQAGVYTVSVTLDGSLTTATQVYSLVVTGGTIVEANPPPSINITAPADGSTALENEPVNIAATASDMAAGGQAGVVAFVEFFVNGFSIGTDAESPYEAPWTPASSGVYALTAQATDSQGASTVSSAVNVSVLGGDGTPSIASFSPASGPAGTSVTVTGTNFANVSTVEFNGVAAATFTVSSLTSITASVPSTATTGPIRVVTGRGDAASADSFTVVQSAVLISQAYGGGGLSGATHLNDYVELYNRSESAVSLTGWTVQYAASAGTTWSTAALSGSIAPGSYYLVALASGGSSGAALPASDASNTKLDISATKGKIALRNSSTKFTGSSPVGQAGLQDFVGYGAANAYEGSGPAPEPSTTTAIFRAGAGATDTGDNATDFSTGTPNPRNAPRAPAITSPLTASGTAGQAFSYQITASQSPTAFGASGLPADLTVDSTSGLISGIAASAGTYPIILSATNAGGTGTATLTLTVASGGGGGGGGTQTLFSEDFASITNGDNTTNGGSSAPWPGNTNFPPATVVKAYQAGGAVKLGSSSATGSITSRTLDLSLNGGSFTVSFKVKGWTTVEGPIKVTVTGLTPQTATYTSTMSGSFEPISMAFTGGTANSTIKIETTYRRAFIDDVVVTTESLVTPVITVGGTLAAVPTTYGTASPAPASFTVSGADMTDGILVTPPAGFEVSQTAGGADGYADTQTVGAAGTIPDTTIHVRLKAGATVGSYSGDIACTSPGATTAYLATAASDVSPAALSITARDQSKAFGTALALGTGQTAFTSTGLALGETIGSVTLTASGGLAAYDAVGTYDLIPSAATGGTFNASNYSISYFNGVLSVTGKSYGDWIAGKPGLNGATGPDEDPELDGLPNGVEYFMGLDPTVVNSGALTPVVRPGEHAVRYRRNRNQQGITGGMVWKSSLLDATGWSDTGVVDTVVEDHGDYEIREAKITVEPSGAIRFMRLRITGI